LTGDASNRTLSFLFNSINNPSLPPLKLRGSKEGLSSLQTVSLQNIPAQVLVFHDFVQFLPHIGLVDHEIAVLLFRRLKGNIFE
jgi:hypothetical protein